MFHLTLGQAAYGTRVESLHELVDAAGLVITVHGSGYSHETGSAIFEADPRLSKDHGVRTNGMILSSIGMYSAFWENVGYPGGSLALLAPRSLYEKQNMRDWIGHFRREVLDRLDGLSCRGFRVGGGGDPPVSDSDFAQAFARAHV
ncbi:MULTISPECIES: hypothetical protein [unclassified Streptomyces]|uniref:hypothetical protein n=1 Tax=unclassified Streptomyces TaxID=2593676 RepID=UPI0033B50A05